MKKEAGIVILLVLLLFVWSCASTPPIDQITADGSTNESEGGESEAADSIESGSETDQPSNLGESPATVNASGTASGANNPGECGGWRCISSKTKIYQNPDCTFGERKDCYYGCDQNDCRVPPTCEPGWKCATSATRAYQERDCTWIQETKCPSGCQEGDCVAVSNTSATASGETGSTDQNQPPATKSYETLSLGTTIQITVEGKEYSLRIMNLEADRVKLQVGDYRSDWLQEGGFFLTQDEVKITVHEIFFQPYQGGRQEITYEAQ